MPFTLYEIDTALESAKTELEQSQKAFGFIPNLHKVLAAAPEVLKAYKALHRHFQNSSFNAAELTVIWQTVNNYHQCHYCLPAHTGIAHAMKVDAELINALQGGELLQDNKLHILQVTTHALVDQRGQLSDMQLAAFKTAGYGEQQLLEIILGLAQKVISNYTNYLADTPVDEPFEQFVR